MITHKDDVDVLLKARAEIDEKLRKHKNTLTILFTMSLVRPASLSAMGIRQDWR